MNAVFKFMILTSLAICAQSCYPMPTENDFSVVPTTNNPAVTKEVNNTSLVPGVGY